MFAAVIFDLDGVLVDTEPLYAAVNGQLFAQLGIRVDTAAYARLVGTSPRETWSFIKEHYKLRDDVTKLLEKAERAKLVQLANSILKPTPGTVELLESLCSSHFGRAVASSSTQPVVEWILRQVSLYDCFDTIIDGDRVSASKPAPDVYLAAAEHLRLPPSACIAIEDSTNGVTSAKTAGMFCIGYRTGSSVQDLSNADLVIASFQADVRERIMTLLRQGNTSGSMRKTHEDT